MKTPMNKTSMRRIVRALMLGFVLVTMGIAVGGRVYGDGKEKSSIQTLDATSSSWGLLAGWHSSAANSASGPVGVGTAFGVFDDSQDGYLIKWGTSGEIAMAKRLAS